MDDLLDTLKTLALGQNKRVGGPPIFSVSSRVSRSKSAVFSAASYSPRENFEFQIID